MVTLAGKPTAKTLSCGTTRETTPNAAPVLLAVVLTDAAFGVVSKVVPQLNVFAVGFPAKVTVGLVVIGASLPFVAGWLDDELQRSVASALHALKVSG